jgi:hypothetical protein
MEDMLRQKIQHRMAIAPLRPHRGPGRPRSAMRADFPRRRARIVRDPGEAEKALQMLIRTYPPRF